MLARLTRLALPPPPIWSALGMTKTEPTEPTETTETTETTEPTEPTTPKLLAGVDSIHVPMFVTPPSWPVGSATLATRQLRRSYERSAGQESNAPTGVARFSAENPRRYRRRWEALDPDARVSIRPPAAYSTS